MPLAEIAALVEGIKGTIDITKGLKSAYDAQAVMQAQTEILERLFNLQSEALTLQENHSALLRKNDELLKKLTELEKWDDAEAQYEMKEVQRGKFVYSYKPTQGSSQPSHWLCPNCWAERRKSVLQADWHDEFDAKYHCPHCKLEMELHFRDRPLDNFMVRDNDPFTRF